MKKILFVLFCFSAAFSAAMFSAGCVKNNPAAPAPTPTVTATSDITADIIVGVLANVGVLSVATVTYQVIVYSPAGVTITTATVTVKGPNGIKNLVYNAGSGYYEYGSASAADFQYGSKYTITVTDGLKTFEQDIVTQSDIDIASNGSTVTWTGGSPGVTANLIMVTDPSFVPHLYGPAITSPYNLAGAGAFSYGAGLYTISTIFSTSQVPAFGGSNPLSTVSVANSKSAAVLK